jgi:hypothetical protein
LGYLPPAACDENVRKWFVPLPIFMISAGGSPWCAGMLCLAVLYKTGGMGCAMIQLFDHDTPNPKGDSYAKNYDIPVV